MTQLPNTSGSGFITKLNPGGTALAYSTYLGGTSGTSSGAGIAWTRRVMPRSPAPPTAPGPVAEVVCSQRPPGPCRPSYGGGSHDAFVTRLGTDGKSLSYSSYLGGSGDDYGTAVAEDAFGNAFLAGYTNSSNFPTQNPIQGSLSGASTYDAWVAKVGLAPAAPVFTGVTGGVSTSAGMATSSQNLTLSGTTVANGTVTLSRADLGVLGTTTANGSGAWSYNYTGTTLPQGTYAFTATVTSNSLTSAASAAYVVSVDTTAPAVTLTVPSSTTSLAPVVQITASDQNGLPDGTAVYVDQSIGGNWTQVAQGTLTGGAAALAVSPSGGGSPGTYPIRARVNDLANNQGTSSTANLVISSANTWSVTGQVLTVDPQVGDAQDQLGNVPLTPYPEFGRKRRHGLGRSRPGLQFG